MKRGVLVCALSVVLLIVAIACHAGAMAITPATSGTSWGLEIASITIEAVSSIGVIIGTLLVAVVAKTLPDQTPVVPIDIAAPPPRTVPKILHIEEGTETDMVPMTTALSTMSPLIIEVNSPMVVNHNRARRSTLPAIPSPSHNGSKELPPNKQNTSTASDPLNDQRELPDGTASLINSARAEGTQSPFEQSGTPSPKHVGFFPTPSDTTHDRVVPWNAAKESASSSAIKSFPTLASTQAHMNSGPLAASPIEPTDFVSFPAVADSPEGLNFTSGFHRLILVRFFANPDTTDPSLKESGSGIIAKRNMYEKFHEVVMNCFDEVIFSSHPSLKNHLMHFPQHDCELIVTAPGMKQRIVVAIVSMLVKSIAPAFLGADAQWCIVVGEGTIVEFRPSTWKHGFNVASATNIFGEAVSEVMDLSKLCRLLNTNILCTSMFANSLTREGEDAHAYSTTTNMTSPDENSIAYCTSPLLATNCCQKPELDDIDIPPFAVRPVDIFRRTENSRLSVDSNRGSFEAGSMASLRSAASPLERVYEIIFFGVFPLAFDVHDMDAFGAYDLFFESYVNLNIERADALATKFLDRYPEDKQVQRLLNIVNLAERSPIGTRVPFFRKFRGMWEEFQPMNRRSTQLIHKRVMMANSAFIKDTTTRRPTRLNGEVLNERLQGLFRRQMSFAISCNGALSQHGSDNASWSDDDDDAEEAPPEAINDDGGAVWRRSGTVLGRGTSGTVYLAMQEGTGSFVALKAVPLSLLRNIDTGNKALEALREEVTLMSSLRHRCLVDYISFCVTPAHVVIIMEYISGGSLQSVVEAFGALPPQTAARYIKDILTGLSVLHAKNIVHRDLKPHNVLVTLNGQCKISDFGTAIQSSEQALNASMTGSNDGVITGSPLFMAPEQARGQISPKSDIWSLGLVAFYMVMGRMPYSDDLMMMPPLSFIVKVGSDEKLVPELPEELSEEARDFFCRCFTRESHLRATADELLLHPWFNMESTPQLLQKQPRVSRKSAAMVAIG